MQQQQQPHRRNNSSWTVGEGGKGKHVEEDEVVVVGNKRAHAELTHTTHDRTHFFKSSSSNSSSESLPWFLSALSQDNTPTQANTSSEVHLWYHRRGYLKMKYFYPASCFKKIYLLFVFNQHPQRNGDGSIRQLGISNASVITAGPQGAQRREHRAQHRARGLHHTALCKTNVAALVRPNIAIGASCQTELRWEQALSPKPSLYFQNLSCGCCQQSRWISEQNATNIL